MGTLIDSQLCRICAEEASLHCPLFDESSRILRERMGFFLPLNIQETSLMPQIVCQKCVESLESLVVFFNRLNQGQLKLFSELAEHKKNRVVPWNGKKMSLFDKKYPSGVVSKPAKNKAIEEFSAGPTFAAVGDNILIEGYSSGGDIKAFEDASMKFECLEPSCRLRFQSYEEIEEHLKIENHSSLTVVHSSEEVNENKESDRLGELSGTQESLNNFNLETTAPQASVKKSRKPHEHSLSLRNRIVGMAEAGLTATQIAQRIPIPRTTIVSIIKKYMTSGNVDNKARSGRPRVWTEVDTERLNLIQRIHKKANVWTISKIFNESRERKISGMTIRRKLVELREGNKRRKMELSRSEAILQEQVAHPEQTNLPPPEGLYFEIK
eukprot:TRINITY_DN6207_c0_g2_i1.p1 TRINITY_DN6207_c0_g2~~TRINITY_DN6207_c0_g2_i1.p1  ORF type:complete len:382 (+),score=74.68 TRINITY_DN6207_c0_g2_i1:107-1252(+)